MYNNWSDLISLIFFGITIPAGILVVILLSEPLVSWISHIVDRYERLRECVVYSYNELLDIGQSVRRIENKLRDKEENSQA
jgi:hypothetical protein